MDDKDLILTLLNVTSSISSSHCASRAYQGQARVKCYSLGPGDLYTFTVCTYFKAPIKYARVSRFL